MLAGEIIFSGQEIVRLYDATELGIENEIDGD